MTKRKGKKARKKIKKIFDKGSKARKRLRKALKDDNISKKEMKKIRAAGATKKQLQKVRKRADKSKALKIGKKVNQKSEIKKLAKKNPKSNNNKNTTTNKFLTNNPPPKNYIYKNNKSGGSGKNNKSGGSKRTKIKGDKQLDKYLEKNVLKKPILQSQKKTQDSWSPNRVERQVAKQWGKRFKSDDFKPKRLDIKAKSTGRLGKYTDKKGNFNQKQYLADVRQSTISRAEKRGFKGDAAKALSRKGPKMPGEIKPKYGSAITDLKNKLGKINYKDQITKTTSKLTQTVKSDASKYKQTGLDIIKRRSSEDGAVPAPKPKQKPK